jgi:predicted metal-dependent HD superfamily phosphohydrolase
MTRTEERFVELWSRSGGARAEAVYADLAQCYGEPLRQYHTLRHVRRCLRYFDLARSGIPHPDRVELALWCHDVIYVPGARDNEQRSADWFGRWAGDRIAMRDRICEAILATRHTGVPNDLDERYTCDIDLAVLGAARSRFREDGARLRAERPDLDDRAYDLRERKILGSLLARPRIYFTDFFQARCEACARENLSWRLGLAMPQ